MAKKQRIVKKTIIEGMPEEIYSIARDPEMWSLWYVGLEGPEELHGTGEKGTKGKFHASIVGMKFPVDIEVTEDHISREKCRWSGKFTGRTSGHQIFEYNLKDGRTEVTLQYESTPSDNLLDRVASRVILDRMQENNLSSTLKNLKVLAEEKITGMKEKKTT